MRKHPPSQACSSNLTERNNRENGLDYVLSAQQITKRSNSSLHANRAQLTQIISHRGARTPHHSLGRCAECVDCTDHSSVYPLILHTLSFKPNTQRWERLTCGKTTITVKCTAIWICVCSVSEPIENTTAHTVRVCSRASLKKTNMQLEAANELKEKN